MYEKITIFSTGKSVLLVINLMSVKKIALHKSLFDLLHLLPKNVHRFELNYCTNYHHDKFENTITHVASVGTFPIARVLIIQS